MHIIVLNLALLTEFDFYVYIYAELNRGAAVLIIKLEFQDQSLQLRVQCMMYLMCGVVNLVIAS